MAGSLQLWRTHPLLCGELVLKLSCLSESAAASLPNTQRGLCATIHVVGRGEQKRREEGRKERGREGERREGERERRREERGIEKRGERGGEERGREYTRYAFIKRALYV